MAAGEKLMKTHMSGAWRAASRMAERQAAESTSKSRPASRASARIGCGATTLPSRSTPRKSASCAKMRRVSSACTMGWNQLVKRPSSI